MEDFSANLFNGTFWLKFNFHLFLYLLEWIWVGFLWDWNVIKMQIKLLRCFQRKIVCLKIIFYYFKLLLFSHLATSLFFRNFR
jgi:hypothetical protein